MATALLTGSAAGVAAADQPIVAVSAINGIDGSELAELVRLSDPATLTDLHDGERRADRIAAILAGSHDRRGIFAVFYREILRDANPMLDAGDFDDPRWARAVSIEFFRQYLQNLHGHLTGGPVTQGWQRYYAMAADPARSPGRVAATALDAHLLIDFPAAIAATNTHGDHTGDFFTIGDSLITTTNRITDELQATYGAQLARFFQLYFLGKAADRLIGQGNTSHVMFQSVRATALASGIVMQNPAACPTAQAGMSTLYHTAEAVFDGLEALGQI
ncbi:hypothetical protein KHQ06_36565 [Nocardia tengchongensis]|uniref:Uncharacterized protein n=1 Tax=Nocardia tengchongensis TaxID=2055889 RepID=A0ABX8CN81_9NOCA|nr:DUF5995 family protein [Nocardia tengchongensis]QVI21409.1 hypothetical protein KHQ06_36565 [Nocardia tengchongensis]